MERSRRGVLFAVDKNGAFGDRLTLSASSTWLYLYVGVCLMVEMAVAIVHTSRRTDAVNRSAERQRRWITLIFAGRNRMTVIRRELPRSSGASSRPESSIA